MSKIIPREKIEEVPFVKDSPGVDEDDHPNSHQNENYPDPHPVGVKPAPVEKDVLTGSPISPDAPAKPGEVSAQNPMGLKKLPSGTSQSEVTKKSV